MNISLILRVACICSVSLLCVVSIKAEVRTAQVIGNNMVLQRDAMVPIWGSADPYEMVSVIFQKQHHHVLADQSGHWRLLLNPLVASATPASMKIVGRRNNFVLHNILVGEVWLVSGQSNMQFPMVGFSSIGVHNPAALQHRLAADLSRPECENVRLFRMTLDLNLPVGQTAGWTACNSDTLAAFSAVGYYFARELQNRLGVPIGILESAVGGTRIEPWTPLHIGAKDSALINKTADSNDHSDTGTLFNKLIEPLAPYALRGVLWYQGESNLLAPGADHYGQKMNEMIQGWRSAWDDCDLPFYYALLAPMKYTLLKTPGLDITDKSLPAFWEQQEDVLNMPNTGLISTNDLVDLAGPAPGQQSLAYVMDLIHPGDKWDVAHRFVLLALTNVYGDHSVVSSGPTVERVSRDASSLKVEFIVRGSTLASRDDKPLSGFEVAGDDLKFMPASARIDGAYVIATSPQVAHPIAIRFGWSETSQPNLINSDQLPAMPFRRMLSWPSDP